MNNAFKDLLQGLGYTLIGLFFGALLAFVYMFRTGGI